MSDETYLAADRFLRARVAPTPAGDEDEDTLGAGYRAFGAVRAARQQALMLELRLRTGDSVAFSYAWLHRVGFDPTAGLTLEFGRHRVTVRGRHLGPLKDAITTHRARWVWEADEPTALLTPEGETLVIGIGIEET